MLCCACLLWQSYACCDDTGETGIVEVQGDREGQGDTYAPPGRYSLMFSGFG